MQIVYRSIVVKQLRKLPKNEQMKVLGKIEALKTNPQAGKHLKGELEGMRSLRSWPFRIIYILEANRICICSVAHRQGVYK